MDFLENIDLYLVKTDDPALLILRAHLLVEERLRNILAKICRSPDEVRKARLSFNQVLYLCRAVVGRCDEPAWDFVARLNEVRNRMAHNLDPGDLDDLIGSVAEKLVSDYAAKMFVSDSADRFLTPVVRFRIAAAYACGYFDSISGSVHLREAYDSEGEV